MKIILKLFTIILVFFPFFRQLAGQTIDISETTKYWRTLFDNYYGPDHNLINGIKYIDYRPNSTGHPFLGENKIYPGTVIINQRTYNDLDLKYDIYTQELILRYIDFSGAYNYIMLNKEFISEFIIGDHYFKQYVHTDGGGAQFYEVIASGEITCLWYWEKNMTHSVISVSDYYNYMPESKKTFLLIGDDFYEYTGTRSFLRQIPELIKEEVRNYVRSKRIRVGRASESQMIQLISYCNNLLKK